MGTIKEEIVLTTTKDLLVAMITSMKLSVIHPGDIEKLGDSFKKLSQKVEEAYNELNK
jgi:hypothetical protein